MNNETINTEKREAIVQAMLELITERGFHATPMSMVAEKAGVAAGTIYHHFKSKEEIINEIYARLKANMGEALVREDASEEDYKKRFYRFWLNLYYHFIDHPKEFLFLEQYANSPFITKVTKEENQRYYQPVIDFLAEGVWSGILRNMDVELLVAMVYGSVATCVKLHLSKELDMNQNRVQQGVQASWDSVKMD
ncbi:MAG: transcriptional regulator, tetr family [Bacteroidetes bacterium]|nr:MAG: transcriptional regulator, tetr family [Bacteroidota bacterium]